MQLVYYTWQNLVDGARQLPRLESLILPWPVTWPGDEDFETLNLLTFQHCRELAILCPMLDVAEIKIDMVDRRMPLFGAWPVRLVSKDYLNSVDVVKKMSKYTNVINMSRKEFSSIIRHVSVSALFCTMIELLMTNILCISR
jgi:hypothetical protein